MEAAVTPLINELLAAPSRAVIAVLLLVIVFLFAEVRNARKELKLAQEKIDAQRIEFLSLVESSQTRFSEKTETLLTNYHSAMNDRNKSDMKVTIALQTLAGVLNKNIDSGDEK